MASSEVSVKVELLHKSTERLEAAAMDLGRPDFLPPAYALHLGILRASQL